MSGFGIGTKFADWSETLGFGDTSRHSGEWAAIIVARNRSQRVMGRCEGGVMMKYGTFTLWN